MRRNIHNLKNGLIVSLLLIVSALFLFGCRLPDATGVATVIEDVSTEENMDTDVLENESDAETVSAGTPMVENDGTENMSDLEDTGPNGGSNNMSDIKEEAPAFEVTEEEKAFYKIWIDENIVSLVERPDAAMYGYYDVNYDGAAELIVIEPMHTYVLQNRNGEVISLCDESKYVTLMPDGKLMKYQFSYDSETYSFYELQGEKYVLCHMLYRRDAAPKEYYYDGIFDSDDDEFWIEDRVVEKGDWYSDLSDWMPYYRGYDENNTDEYYFGYEYYFAEVEYTRYLDEPMTLPYDNAEDAYQAFLIGVQGAYFSENYVDNMSLAPVEGRCLTLYDVVNIILNEGGGSFAGSEIEWSYIDCGNDGQNELLLKVNNVSGDHFYTYIILKYMNNQLYFCYSDMGWSRSDLIVDEYGVFSNWGSSGAGDHSGEDFVVDAAGKKQIIYEVHTVWPGWSLRGDDEMLETIEAVEAKWIEEYEAAGNENVYDRFGMLQRERYVIGDDVYYCFTLAEDESNPTTEEQLANYESIMTAWKDAGLVFHTADEINALIEVREAELGVADLEGEEITEFEALENYYFYY